MNININDFSDKNEEGAFIRDGGALISIIYTNEDKIDVGRFGIMSIHENGEEIESCGVVILSNGEVHERGSENFYRIKELYLIFKR